MNPTVPRSPSGTLPEPSAEALAHSEHVAAFLRRELAGAGGWLPFSRWMELALYAPGLGYYSAGSRKLGSEGDFTTAPEMSPLFGQVLARQVAQLFEAVPRTVLEVGAGSGALAAALLEALEQCNALPEQYWILELSADLRERERDTLAARVPHLLDRVAWLNRLPPSFSGVVIGNEVLDAMPCEVFRTTDHGVEEGGVVLRDGRFDWDFRAAPEAIAGVVNELALPPGYRSELGTQAASFVASLGAIMETAAALFIDYGFPQAEYYHPQRSTGTLMCHYRHHAHDNPFFLPGLQDITAHVDFSAIAADAAGQGLEVAGYTSQAHFLINCGITELLSRHDPTDTRHYLVLANAAQRLMSPAEMGELFKVIALTRNVDLPLIGFARGDRTGAL